MLRWRLFFILSSILFVARLNGQVFTSATASAAIVTPVGTEGVEDADIVYLSRLRGMNSNNSNYSINNHFRSINLRFNSDIQQITAVKLLHNNYTFGIIQHTSPISKDVWAAESGSKKLTGFNNQVVELNSNTSLLTVWADFTKPNASGFYQSKNPLEVIIGFD